jgi:hypothetical protein
MVLMMLIVVVHVLPLLKNVADNQPSPANPLAMPGPTGDATPR